MERRWFSLEDRPELFDAAIAVDGDANDASFMQHDTIGDLANASRLRDRWPGFFLVLVEGDQVIARAVMIPFSELAPGRETLPDTGWDGAVLWAAQDALDGIDPTVACALEINVDPSSRGQGISSEAVYAMRDTAHRRGMSALVAPVRPPDKAGQPFVPMNDYARQTRDDGLPIDRWLRVHVRAGGEIVGIAPFSMVVVGALDDWRRWTGMSFDSDGLIAVPGGLAPVLVSQHLGTAVYAEANVWVRHRL